MTTNTIGRAVMAALMGTTAAAAIGSAAWAQAKTFDIPAQSAATAVVAFARQGDVQVLLTGDAARGRTTRAVKGVFGVEEGLSRLLDGAGLTARQTAPGAYLVSVETSRPQVEAAVAAEPAQIEELLVTGTRIRGAPPASPVIVVSQQDMRDAGQYDLGDVVRSIPQNFAGGQNPGAGVRGGSQSGNANGASNINLRGVGPDGTLTLLNGHRLATNRGSGFDISAIPVGAIARLEILPDGASALYGSDAVGGVANIVTRRDYTGVTLGAVYASSLDGGFDQTQFSASGGLTWRGGGIVGAVATTSNSEIRASQRRYAATMPQESTLYPDVNRTNLFVAAHQDLTDNIRTAVDILYSNSDSAVAAASTLAPVRTSGIFATPTIRTFLVAPSVEVGLPRDWRLSAYGTYGRDRSRSNNATYSASLLLRTLRECFCNTSDSAEVSLEGPVVRLPAGEARLATGVGYRSNQTDLLQTTNGVVTGSTYDRTDRVTYGFGELDLPIIGGDQGIPFVQSLRANIAGRYEHFENFGGVATPKLGLIYEANESLTFRTSWGRSFKAPTFIQRYSRNQVVLSNVTGYGTTFPAGATFLEYAGGNPNLKPERARSFTFSVEYRPPWIEGLQLRANVYDIRYRDRVIVPIARVAGALTNPTYADLVTRNPSAAQQSAAIAAAPQGLLSATTAPYDPTRVVAILDERFTNASRQVIRGLDISGDYRIRLSGNDQITFATSSTYLDIVQTRIAGEVALGVTGNFYQPRHFTSRSSVRWDHGGLALGAYVNHTGAARYRAVTPIVNVKAETTLDLVGQWKAPSPIGAVVGIRLANALGADPTIIPGSAAESSFDAASFAVTGRVVSISVSRSW